MREWQDIAGAPRDGTATWVLLGETIPDMPDGRVGTWISSKECAEIGDPYPHGGWLIWNSGSDWFITDDVLAWCELPAALKTAKPLTPPTI